MIAMLCAQAAGAQTVVMPEPALDASRAALRDQLLQFRDSLNTVHAAAARLQRDYRQASPAVLSSRARVMSEACARSARNVAPARTTVISVKTNDPARLRRRGEMVRALEQLGAVLSRCQADFQALSRPGQEEKVRGYGNPRAIRVQGSIRQYERALSSFFAAMGIKVFPLGSRVRPLAG
ncbi:MAG TPA: hypothetical protein VJ808_10035 [Gemmatimonadales bacterium]|nr:hypothetical protein [Gemmatimonadales bacterium]